MVMLSFKLWSNFFFIPKFYNLVQLFLKLVFKMIFFVWGRDKDIIY